MQIEIKLDENCKEPKIIVVTNKMTDEINEIMKRLSDEQPKMIAGFKDDIVEVHAPSAALRNGAAAGQQLFCPNIKLGYYQSEKSQGF